VQQLTSPHLRAAGLANPETMAPWITLGFGEFFWRFWGWEVHHEKR